jgi:hypothetical protein
MIYSLTIISNKNPPPLPAPSQPKKPLEEKTKSIFDHAIYKELHKKEKEKIKEKRKLLSRTIYYL